MIISALLFSYFNSHPKKIENRIGTTGVQLIDRGLAKSIGLNRRINNLSNSYNRSKIDSIKNKTC